MHPDEQERSNRGTFHEARDGSGSPDRTRLELSVGGIFPPEKMQEHGVVLRLPALMAGMIPVVFPICPFDFPPDNALPREISGRYFLGQSAGSEDRFCHTVVHSSRKSNPGYPPDDTQMDGTVLVRGGGNLPAYADLSRARVRQVFAIPEREIYRCSRMDRDGKDFVQSPGAGDGQSASIVMADVSGCSESLSVVNVFQRKYLRHFFIRVLKRGHSRPRILPDDECNHGGIPDQDCSFGQDIIPRSAREGFRALLSKIR